MAYCGPRGIPHSEFLLWSVDDQAKALGWMAEESRKCSGCGTADWEWAEDRRAYRAEPYVCMGCMARESAQKEHAETAKQMPGLQIRLMRGGDVSGES